MNTESAAVLPRRGIQGNGALGLEARLDQILACQSDSCDAQACTAEQTSDCALDREPCHAPTPGARQRADVNGLSVGSWPPNPTPTAPNAAIKAAPDSRLSRRQRASATIALGIMVTSGPPPTYPRRPQPSDIVRAENRHQNHSGRVVTVAFAIVQRVGPRSWSAEARTFRTPAAVVFIPAAMRLRDRSAPHARPG
jgi:hypothetical protein